MSERLELHAVCCCQKAAAATAALLTALLPSMIPPIIRVQAAAWVTLAFISEANSGAAIVAPAPDVLVQLLAHLCCFFQCLLLPLQLPAAAL